MFTGIVETIGTVTKLEGTAAGRTLTISDAEQILGDCHEGDSIAINGTCLTVTHFDRTSFTVGISPETLRRTNIGDLDLGSKVNLERAVSASTRMGGHFVQGHVDTIATILSVTSDGDALTFRFQPRDPSVLRYVVEKGFITIDGASLTITKVKDGQDGWWEVMLIPYTQEKVVTAAKTPGEHVNVEVDMVGKYVEKNVASYFESSSAGEITVLEKLVGRIVDKRLRAAGIGVSSAA